MKILRFFYLKIITLFVLFAFNYSILSMTCENSMEASSTKDKPLLSLFVSISSEQEVAIRNFSIDRNIVDQKRKKFISVKSHKEITEEFNQFLTFLINRIGVERTLTAVLDSVDSFIDFHLDSFLQKVDLFESILGYEKVNELLTTHLSYFIGIGFVVRDKYRRPVNRGKVDEVTEQVNAIRNLTKLIQDIQEYVTKPQLQKIIEKSLSVFFYARITARFRDVAKHIERFIGKEGVRKKITQSLSQFQSISVVKLESLEQMWGEKTLEDNLRKYSLHNSIFQQGNSAVKNEQTMNRRNSIKQARFRETITYMEELLQSARNRLALGEVPDVDMKELQEMDQFLDSIKDGEGQYGMEPSEIEKFSRLLEQLGQFLPHTESDSFDSGLSISELS